MSVGRTMCVRTAADGDDGGDDGIATTAAAGRTDGRKTEGGRGAGGCDLDSSMQKHGIMKWGRVHSAVQGDWTILTPVLCRLLEPLQIYPWTLTALP